MSLGFTHCSAGWSYSGFNEFRRRLAREIGIDLSAMLGFRGKCPTCGRWLDDGLPWDKITDPIKHLLHHSDCDGDIKPDVAPLVAKRLRELVADWPEDYDHKNALELADGLDAAAAAGEPLEFC